MSFAADNFSALENGEQPSTNGAPVMTDLERLRYAAAHVLAAAISAFARRRNSQETAFATLDELQKAAEEIKIYSKRG